MNLFKLEAPYTSSHLSASLTLADVKPASLGVQEKEYAENLFELLQVAHPKGIERKQNLLYASLLF